MRYGKILDADVGGHEIVDDSVTDGRCNAQQPDFQEFQAYAPGLNSCIIQNTNAATAADAGIVRIHAQTIRRATPHRTAESRCTAPTPTIAPVMV